MREVARLHHHQDQPPRQRAERPGQLHDVCDAEAVGADRRRVPRQSAVPDGEDGHASGQGTGCSGVHDDDRVAPGQVLEKSQRLGLDHDLQTGDAQRRDPTGDSRTDSVISSPGVAHPDQQGRHRCSTVRSRKCVAQEMQGS